MKKTIPVYLIQGLTLASLMTLSACTSMPTAPVKSKLSISQKAKGVEVEQASSKNILPAETLMALTEDELEIQIQIAKNEADWGRYLQFNHQLWQMSTEGGQATIEQQVWDSLSQQTLAETEIMLENLSQHPAETVQHWAMLLSIFKGPVTSLPQNLETLLQEQPNAIYSKHLVPGLLGQLSTYNPVTQIAVLLPFEGKYQQVSQQIRNGILKAYFASDQQVALKFYDSSNLDNLNNTYFQAKLEGAEFIIGPLRKEAVKQLVTFEDKDILALNVVREAPFTQFSYKAADEIAQMVELFKQKNYQYIGILTNDSSGELKTAHALQKAWQDDESQTAVISVYPDKKPKLRDALGALINADASKARFLHLQRMSDERLSYFARTRKDFDAIVIIDNSRRIAVFQPQLAFFQLKVPIYGSLQLSPKKLQDIKPNRDLRGVQFLTHPVTLSPANLSTNFEAFGWDSFQISQHIDAMHLGGYLKTGKTGEIFLEENVVQQNLIWAKYNRRGFIKRWTGAQIKTEQPVENELEAPKITVKNIYRSESTLDESTIQKIRNAAPFSLF